jgi:hypothetical protein
MANWGRPSSALALEVYANKMERNRDTGARMDAGADSAQMGTVAIRASASLPLLTTEKPPFPAAP